MTGVQWLTSELAAIHLGFVNPDGTAKTAAFKTWCQRRKPRTYWLDGRKRFRVVDLDRCVEIEPDTPMRVVRGGQR